MKKNLHFTVVALLLSALSIPSSAQSTGSVPVDKDGRPLNLDFESGTLKGWFAEGNAFERQPVRGDTVSVRRSDMKSGHAGNFWVGSYEVGGDEPQGKLESAPFKVTQPFASFLVGGGSQESTRVELVLADSKEVFFKVSGNNDETMKPVVVDLAKHAGKSIFIRVVDQSSGGWGHVNFDDFKLHANRPKFANEVSAATAAKSEMPALDVVKFAGTTPEQAAAEMTLPPGFKATLFAGEPDVQQPIAFAIDHRGRLWVAEAYTYPIRAKEGEGKDRILVFEDTDGDGKFNRRTVFMEGLNLVSGLEVGFGGVWVGAAPNLMFIPIQDGDEPKPAGKPQILLDGWDYKRDTHETLNTFTWGPDGWLYGCHGVFCPSLVGKPGAPENERQWMDAGVWRYHPTKHIFEVFAEGTSNPWGVDFDERGQCWIEACVIPHLFHMIQGGRYHRQGGEHFSISLDETARNEKHREQGSRKPIFPYVYEDIKTVADHLHYAGDKGPHAGNARSGAVGGGHAHAGLMVYQGDNWPEEYRGKLFMNNIHGARINMDIPERAGSGFVGHHGKDMINFNDKWSQILNLQSGPDGAVYLIDWYDKNECHHNDVNGHDRSNGRIFKVSYGETKFEKVDLQKLNEEQLVKLFSSNNEFQSRHARRILQERFAKYLPALPPDSGASLQQISKASHALEVVNKELWNDFEKDTNSSTRLNVLWGLHLTAGISGMNTLRNLFADKDEFVRAWAIQLSLDDDYVRKSEGNANSPYAKDLLAEFAHLAREDKSPAVRLYLASTMQRVRVEDRWDVIAALSQHAEDANDHNIPLMVWYAAEPLVARDTERALKLAENSKLPKLLNFTARRAGALNTPEAFAAITKALLRATDDAHRLDILSGLSTSLQGQRKVAAPQGWSDVESKLGASQNTEVRSLVQSLSLTFGSAQALASLRKTLMDASANAGARRAAYDSLFAAKDEGLPPLLQQLLKDSQLQGPAIRGLAAYDDAKTPAAILAVYPSLPAGPKRDALNALSSRAVFAVPLLAAIGDGKITRQDLTADLVQQLRNLKNPEVNDLLTKVWGVARESAADKLAEIGRFKKIYYAGGSTPGDAVRGRVVFAKTCQQCHTLFGTGGKVGPDLTGSNRGDLDYILQNIVDPNAVIPNDYRSWNIDMKDDRVVTGILKEQN
ncbi:MAG: dehydrogenase, partial [Verrucomicrobia bacterium]|nr:dehydrogenase [Verrucomicrobiota bacterium]